MHCITTDVTTPRPVNCCRSSRIHCFDECNALAGICELTTSRVCPTSDPHCHHIVRVSAWGIKKYSVPIDQLLHIPVLHQIRPFLDLPPFLLVYSVFTRLKTLVSACNNSCFRTIFSRRCMAFEMRHRTN
eukprot:6473289-Amphidinium_carterae.1